MSDDRVMMPSPPICISTRITPAPKADQCPPVSTTERPVTHTAEVAVNSAVTQPVPSGVSVATGRNSSAPPTRLATANASTTYCAGWRSASLDPPNRVGTNAHATAAARPDRDWGGRSEEHTSELQSLMRISYAVL